MPGVVIYVRNTLTIVYQMISGVLQCGLLLHVFMDSAKALVVCVFYTITPVLFPEKVQ